MKIVFFANTEWYLFNFRLSLAKHLRAFGHEVVMLSPPGPFGARLEEEGFRWRPIPMSRRSTNPLTELPALFALRRILSEERPDLIHNYAIKCVVYGTLVTRTMSNSSVVSAFDGRGFLFSNTEFKARVLRVVVSRLIQFCGIYGHSIFVLQNDGDRRYLTSRRLLHENKIRVIKGGTGIDTGRFGPPSERPPGEPTVLFASRLIWDKRIEEFVKAARKLKEEGFTANMLVVGTPDPGTPGSVEPEDIERWSKTNSVELLGHVEDMPALLRRTDIVVLATAYGEGVPRILIEGAASGAALIASDHPGCREIVDDRQNGILIPPRNRRLGIAA